MAHSSKMQVDGVVQDVIKAMTFNAAPDQEDKVINLFKRYADDTEKLPLIWSTFRQTAIQSSKTTAAVIHWIGSSPASKSLVANLLGLEVTSVSEEMVEEFVLSQLSRPIETARAESLSDSRTIKNSSGRKKRSSESKAHADKLVNMVMQALAREKRLTFLTDKHFRNESFYNLLCGYLPNGSPMKDKLSPDRIHPNDITGLLLKLQERYISKKQARKRNKKGPDAILNTVLSQSEIVDTMKDYFGVVQTKATQQRGKVGQSCKKKKRGRTKSSHDKNGNSRDAPGELIDDGSNVSVDNENKGSAAKEEETKSKNGCNRKKPSHVNKHKDGGIDGDQKMGDGGDDSNSAICHDSNGGMDGDQKMSDGGDDSSNSNIRHGSAGTDDSNKGVINCDEGSIGIAGAGGVSSKDPTKTYNSTCCKCLGENPKLLCPDCSQSPSCKPKKGNNCHDWENLLLMHQECPETVVVTEYPPSVLLQAVSLVYPELVRLLNEKGQPLDLLLKSGRNGRRMLSLPIKPHKKLKMTAKCSPVASEEIVKKFLSQIKANNGNALLVSPMVISLEGVFSTDFKEACLNVVDQLRFCKDKSGSGGSCNRASIYRPAEDTADTEDGIFIDIARLLPLIKLGLKNAIQSVEATKLESILHEIQTELSNLFIDAVQETIQRINCTDHISDIPNWKKQFETIGLADKYRVQSELDLENDEFDSENAEEDSSTTDEEDTEAGDTLCEDLSEEECYVLSPVPGTVGTRASKRLAQQPSNDGKSKTKKRKDPSNKQESSMKRLKTQPTKGMARKSNRKEPRDNRMIKRKGPSRHLVERKKKSRLSCIGERGSVSTVKEFFLNLQSKSFFGGHGGRKKRVCPKLPRFQCNILIMKCGNDASYGNHQDGSWILNSESVEFKTCLNDKTRLPTVCEMMVPTIVLAREGYTTRTKLVHSRGGVVLSQVTTGNNSAHIQSPGCNSFGIQHKSAAIKEKRSVSPAQHAARCVFTGRTGIDPKYDEECYKERILEDDLSHSAIKAKQRQVRIYNTYDQFNVTRSRTTKAHPGKGGKCVPLWEYQEIQPQSVLLPAIPKAQTFSQLSREDWDGFFVDNEDGIRAMSRPPRALAIKPNSKADVVANYKTTSHFLGKGKIIHLLDPKGNRLPLQPMHTDSITGRPLHIGMKVCRDEIPLSFTAYSNDTIEPKYPNIFVLHHQYKNIPGGINQHIEFYEKLERLSRLPEGWAALDTAKLRQEYNNLPPIFICGSGGSSQKAGSKTPSANSTIVDPTYTVGQPQTTQNPGNLAMLLCEERQNAIAVMVDLEQWRKPDQVGENDKQQADEEMEDDEDEDDFFQALRDDEEVENALDQDEEDEPPICDETIMRQLDNTQDLFFMNYYHVKHAYRREKLLPSEIEKRFAHLPSYPAREHDNLSYLRHKHFEFELEKSFDFHTVLKCFDPDRSYSTLQVVAEGPILVDSSASQNSALKGLDAKEKDCLRSMFPKTGALPEDWVTREDIITHLIELEEEEAVTRERQLSQRTTNKPKQQKQEAHLQTAEDNVFEKAIGAQPYKADIKQQDRRYRVNTRELVPVVVAMMAASAVRFDKTVSTEVTQTSKGGKLVHNKVCAVPPRTLGVDRLPDPLRRCARPCPNPDADVVVCHFRSNASIFLKGKMNTVGDEYHMSFKTPDLTDHSNCETVAECMLMAIASRLTGKVSMLSGFTEWIKLYKNGKDPHGGRCLPTSDSVDDFIEFVRAHKGNGGSESLSPFVSRQHSGAVPKVFLGKRGGKKRFCAFLKRFADRHNEGGMRSIIDYMQFAASDGGVDRQSLRDITEMAINTCSGAQIGKNLDFLVHKAISDVESLFPGFAGNVETSSVGFGSGSRIGLRILTRDIKRMSDVGRFDHVCRKVMESLESLDDTTLLAMGYKRVKRDSRDVIVSWLTGRELSRTDVEHWCCKVYICMTACHPSRTISENPKCSSPHCWPLPMKLKWVEPLESHFKQVWDAFLKLQPTHLSVEYPMDLRFLPSRVALGV